MKMSKEELLFQKYFNETVVADLVMTAKHCAVVYGSCIVATFFM